MLLSFQFSLFSPVKSKSNCRRIRFLLVCFQYRKNKLQKAYRRAARTLTRL
jgi:hypothetical protein